MSRWIQLKLSKTHADNYRSYLYVKAYIHLILKEKNIRNVVYGSLDYFHNVDKMGTIRMQKYLLY